MTRYAGDPADTAALLAAMHANDRAAVEAVGGALPDVARAADLIARRLEAGGRWFDVGAGTSGRIGVLDASEIPPTFGVDPARVTALLAGGRNAMFEAVEGAEDDAARGAGDLEAAGLSGADAVVGLAASGRTPYVVGALERARAAGAATVSVVCAPGTPLASLPDVAIVVPTPEEAVRGSTRLTAGTAQKLVLNMLSTAVFARLGLVHRGEMVAMRPTNAKLRERAERIVADLLGVDAEAARRLLESARGHLPAALVAGRWGLVPEAARDHLRRNADSVSRSLEMAPRKE